MNPQSLIATLEYWQEAGIDFLSGERLGFSARVKDIPTPNRLPWGAPTAPETVSISPPPPEKITPEPPITTLLGPDLPLQDRIQKLDTLAQSLAQCTQCDLARMRQKLVFGVGNAAAQVVFVGEGPGADEDLAGEPFVGAAGKLLDKMIQAAGLQRDQVYIANVVKCRPPGNRNPLPAEITLCQGFLFDQLETIRPKAIFALGRFAVLCLLGHEGQLGTIRGRIASWRGIPVIPSYHPAFYLRSPSRKKDGWEDLLRLVTLLGMA